MRALVLLTGFVFAACAAREHCIARVEFLPEIHGAPMRDAHVLYQDGALPVPTPEGTLWTFGDTFLGTRDAAGTPAWDGAHSNTMAWLPAHELGVPPRLEYLRDERGRARQPLALLPDEDAAKRRLWPLAGVFLDGRVFLSYGLIDVTGPGPWGFRAVGTGLATSAPPFTQWQRLRAPDVGSWPIDASSLVVDGDAVLLFAPRRFHGEQDPRSGLLVARVRVADLAVPARYEFFAGFDADGAARWTADPATAQPAADDVAGQASVAWCPHLGAWLLATSSDFFHANTIRLRHAASPLGPWRALGTDDGRITVPERAGERTSLIYCTMLHPELDADGGRTITLTFCRMLARDWAFTNPEAVRITF